MEVNDKNDCNKNLALQDKRYKKSVNLLRESSSSREEYSFQKYHFSSSDNLNNSAIFKE